VSHDLVPSGIVTLLSDFGQRDHYVAAMKGVMLGIDPLLALVDCCHLVQQYNVREGAWLLGNYAFDFPAGTVHLAVVDPGVGSPRAPIACLADGQVFVVPDNGLLSFVLQNRGCCARCIELASIVGVRPGRAACGKGISPTFHGRDIFAPAAAMLASGKLKFENLGKEISPLVLPVAPAEERPGCLFGVVLHIDAFGNIVTSISHDHAQGRKPLQLRLAGIVFSDFVEFYAQRSPGTLVALWGSSGRLEVSVVQGDAGGLLRVRPGDSVECELGGA